MVRSLALCPDDTKQDSVVNSIIPRRNPLSPSHPVLSVLHPQGCRKRFGSAAARRSFGGASPPTKVFSFATSSRCSHTRLSQKHGCTKSSDGPISCAVPQRYEARLGGEQYNTGEKPTVMLYTYLHESPCRDTRQKQNKKQFSVCVCVFSSHSLWMSSSLGVPAGVTQEEGHTGFFIHLPSAVCVP